VDNNAKVTLRAFLTQTLEAHGDRKGFADTDSLFVSGRLDSLSMMTLIVHLEEAFGIDFAQVDFDVDLIDSVNDIASFVDDRLAR